MRGIYIMDMEENADSSSDSDGAPEVSIHAMTGITTGDTMLLSTTVSQTPFIALVDSGSIHCFMSTTTAEHLGLRLMPPWPLGRRRQWRARSLRQSLPQHPDLHSW